MDPNTDPPVLPGSNAAQGIEHHAQAPWPSQQSMVSSPPPPNLPPPPAPPPPATDVASSVTMSSAQSAQSSVYSTPPASASGIAFLPLLNQTATQRRISVEYPATFAGPSHAGEWEVKCIGELCTGDIDSVLIRSCSVGNVERGHARGPSKQLAKEEAARQAYLKMGWDARPGSANYTRASSEYSQTPSSYSRPAPVKEEDFDMESINPSSSISNHGDSMPSYSQQPYHPQPFSPYGSSAQAQSNSPAPTQSTATFLPMFNQMATQRRLMVEYPAEFSGPAHAGRWTVKCLVNGIVKGQGQGSSKQLAKEEAAKLAYYAMGWAPRK
jgi:hypothetical protein